MVRLASGVFRKCVVVLAAGALFSVLPLAEAAGRRRPDTPPDTPSAPAQATPVRRISVAPVGTLPFTLPNGSRVSLSADLETLVATAAVQTGVFAPTTSSEPDACDSWIELRSAVSTLDLNVTQLGVRFGYSLQSGETGVVSGINGTARVTIGLLAMDFAVYQCSAHGCSAVAATTATHATAGTEVALEIDFGQITTGPGLVHNTPLGRILRKIMAKGLGQLASSPQLNRLGWKAKVRNVDAAAGTLVFDQGAQSGIGAGQGFEIYAVTPSTGICDVYQVVATARTTQVNTLSSVAQIEQVFDPRGVREGDLVTIRMK